jgi:hypothetical protein
MITRLVLLAGTSVLGASLVSGQEAEKRRGTILKGADAVLIAKLDKQTPGGVQYTLPPVYHSTLHFIPKEVVKGDLKKGKAMKANHWVRQDKAPVYNIGKECIVALEYDKGRKVWSVILLEIATKENIKEVKAMKKAKQAK